MERLGLIMLASMNDTGESTEDIGDTTVFDLSASKGSYLDRMFYICVDGRFFIEKSISSSASSPHSIFIPLAFSLLPD